MLRARTRRTTASTGVTLTVTHGMGQVPDFWSCAAVSNRGLGRTAFITGRQLTNTIDIVNSIQTTVTVDIFTVFYNGRLY
jgi:hypothetical protein